MMADTLCAPFGSCFQAAAPEHMWVPYMCAPVARPNRCNYLQGIGHTDSGHGGKGDEKNHWAGWRQSGFCVFGGFCFRGF